MGRRAGVISTASKPAGAGSSWRLFAFISNAFYLLPGILQKTILSLKLALVLFIDPFNLNAREPSTDSTCPANRPNRHSVVQGRDAPLPPVEQEEMQNDAQAAPAPVLPTVVNIPPIIPRRNEPAHLMGSLHGILAQ